MKASSSIYSAACNIGPSGRVLASQHVLSVYLARGRPRCFSRRPIDGPRRAGSPRASVILGRCSPYVPDTREDGDHKIVALLPEAPLSKTG